MSMHRKSVNLSRLFLYYFTREFQGRIGRRGAELGATFLTLKTKGCCIDRLWPFIYARVDKSPNYICIEDALQYRLGEYEPVQMTNFDSYLNRNIPVVVGMRTGRQFAKLRGPLAEQRYCPINDTTNRISHGHAVTIVGYDNNLNGGSWIVANSMGLRWGDKGFGAIPYSCEVDIGEAYAMHSFAGLPAEKKIPDN